MGHGLDKTATGKTLHRHRTGRARRDQHQIGIKKLVQGDAGLKKTIAKAQLHKHQDARKGNTGQCHRQPHRLTGEQQPGQGDAAAGPRRGHQRNLLKPLTGRSP